VGQLIGELEALDQPVANLFVRRLALVAGEALAKTPYGVAERGGVELHRTPFYSIGAASAWISRPINVPPGPSWECSATA
jgi:hypothetical protein